MSDKLPAAAGGKKPISGSMRAFGHAPFPVTELDIPMYLFYTEQGDGGNRKAVSRVDDTIAFAFAQVYPAYTKFNFAH